MAIAVGAAFRFPCPKQDVRLKKQTAVKLPPKFFCSCDVLSPCCFYACFHGLL